MGPIHFKEIFKEKVWGGQNLAKLLDKKLPISKKIGESWELSDFGQDCSIVDQGPFKGQSLRELLAGRSKEIFGRGGVAEFPLLFKFLDAVETLSVQVHPHKHEAWYILQAQPGAKLYLGLKEGVGRKEFQTALAGGAIQQCLVSIEPQQGQCYYLSSGLTHALGGGLVVAEIQTPEQITYRVYDWGRDRLIQPGLSLETIRFQARPEVTTAGPEKPGQTVQLMDCPDFTVERAVWPAGQKIDVAGQEMQVWMILSGTAQYCGSNERMQMGKGQTLLLPTCCDGRIEIENPMTILVTRSKNDGS